MRFNITRDELSKLANEELARRRTVPEPPSLDFTRKSTNIKDYLTEQLPPAPDGVFSNRG